MGTSATTDTALVEMLSLTQLAGALLSSVLCVVAAVFLGCAKNVRRPEKPKDKRRSRSRSRNRRRRRYRKHRSNNRSDAPLPSAEPEEEEEKGAARKPSSEVDRERKQVSGSLEPVEDKKSDKAAVPAPARPPEKPKSDNNNKKKDKKKEKTPSIEEEFLDIVEPTVTQKRKREEELEREKRQLIKQGFYQERSDEDDTLEPIRSLKEEDSYGRSVKKRNK